MQFKLLLPLVPLIASALFGEVLGGNSKCVEYFVNTNSVRVSDMWGDSLNKGGDAVPGYEVWSNPSGTRKLVVKGGQATMSLSGDLNNDYLFRVLVEGDENQGDDGDFNLYYKLRGGNSCWGVTIGYPILQVHVLGVVQSAGILPTFRGGVYPPPHKQSK